MMQKKLLIVTILGFLLVNLIPSLSAQEEIAFPILSTETVNNEFTSEVTTHIYILSATEGDVVSISMSQTEDSELDPYLVLLGPQGELIAEDDDSGEPVLASRISEVEIPATGLYFVVASSFQFVDDILEFEIEAGESLGYTLKASGFTASEDTKQFLITEIAHGKTVTGEISEEKPVSYYSFTAEEGQSAEITLTSKSIDTLLYLIAPDGSRIAVNDDDSGTDSAVRGVELPLSGQYIVFATNVFFYSSEYFDGGAFQISLSVE